MVLSVDTIAEAINEAIGATDKDGLPIAVTPEMRTYAEAVVDTLQQSIFAHAVVTGITAAAAPLVEGRALNGIFATVPAPTWLAALVSGFGLSDPAQLAINATASTAYIQLAGKVNFGSGKITGVCGSTAESPGPLIAGAGQLGVIERLKGSDWAALVLPPLGDPVLATKIYDAIIKRIEADANATYATGSVTGTCPSSSGPLASGVGIGGFVI